MNSSWKTTIGGLLAALGSFLVNSQTGVLSVIGQVAQAIGLFFLGASAQDAKKQQNTADGNHNLQVVEFHQTIRLFKNKI